MDLFGIKRRKRRVQLWKDVAAEYGGSHEPARGYFRRVNEQLCAVVRGVPVVVDTYVVSSGNAHQVYSRATAPAMPNTPRWSVTREGLLASIGKALGGQDIELGDPAFDAAFVIKSDDAAVVRRWWSDAARARLLAIAKPTIKSNGEKIQLVTTGLWEQRDVITNAIELLAELGSRDLYGTTWLSQIADATLSPDGRRAELDTGIRVVIQAEAVDGSLAMVARAADPPPLETFDLAIEDGKPAHELGALSQGARVALSRVGSGTLTSAPGELRFTWRGLEIDPEYLRAGAELLGATARPPEVYR